MSNSCDSDGPQDKSVYEKVYDLAAELLPKAAARVELLKRAAAKMPRSDPQTDPLTSVPVKQAIRAAHEQGICQGKNEAYREVASLLSGIGQENQQNFRDARPYLQTLMQKQLRTYEHTVEDLGDTEERPVLHPMVFVMMRTESVLTFFKRALSAFEKHRKSMPIRMEIAKAHEAMARDLIEIPLKIEINTQLREDQIKLW